MKRNLPIGIALVLGFTALSGCAPQPQPVPVVATAPPAAPVAMLPVPPPPVIVASAPTQVCPPAVKRHVAAVVQPRPVVHHHWAHRPVARPVYVALTPYCGGIVHPCNVDHLTVPVQ